MTYKVLKKVSIIVVGLLSLIFSLIKYVKSYEIWSDEAGTDISFNTEYLLAIVISLFIIALGVTTLVLMFKNKESKNATLYVGLASSSLVSFYSLGVLFKALNKGKAFADYQNYLYIGLVTLALLCYFVFEFIEKRKEKD